MTDLSFVVVNLLRDVIDECITPPAAAAVPAPRHLQDLLMLGVQGLGSEWSTADFLDTFLRRGYCLKVCTQASQMIGFAVCRPYIVGDSC